MNKEKKKKYLWFVLKKRDRGRLNDPNPVWHLNNSQVPHAAKDIVSLKKVFRYRWLTTKSVFGCCWLEIGFFFCFFFLFFFFFFFSVFFFCWSVCNGRYGGGKCWRWNLTVRSTNAVDCIEIWEGKNSFLTVYLFFIFLDIITCKINFEIKNLFFFFFFSFFLFLIFSIFFNFFSIFFQFFLFFLFFAPVQKKKNPKRNSITIFFSWMA